MERVVVLFEFLEWKENFSEIQLMKLDKALDFPCGERVVVFSALFDTQ